MGRGHMPLDFHAPTKAFSNLHVPVIEGLKTNFRRRRLVDEPGFEKVKVASWGTWTLPH